MQWLANLGFKLLENKAQMIPRLKMRLILTDHLFKWVHFKRTYANLGYFKWRSYFIVYCFYLMSPLNHKSSLSPPIICEAKIGNKNIEGSPLNKIRIIFFFQIWMQKKVLNFWACVRIFVKNLFLLIQNKSDDL